VSVRQGLRAALLLVVIVTTGCGGSRSPRERYASKVSAMCEDFAAREQKLGKPTGPQDLAARGKRLVAIYEGTILRPLLALDAPAGVAPQAAALRVVARQLAARNTTLNGQAGRIAAQLGASSCTS